jgi:hypothetical protein
LERVGAQQERLLEALDRAGIVAGGLGGDPQAALGGVAHRLGYVVGAGNADERRRALVVCQVEGLARGVPGLVALSQDLSVEAGLEFGETRCMRNEHWA